MRTDWTALHIMKFFAVAIMVVLHAVVWLITWDDAAIDPNHPIFTAGHNLPWLPLFLYLPLCLPATAGAAFRLQLAEIVATPKALPIAKIIRTALVLAVLSFAMNAISWGIDDLEWDVLQFIGVAYCLTAVILRYAPRYTIYFVGVATLVFSVTFRNLFPANEDVFLGVLIGTNSPHVFWPLFPWFFTFVFGYALSDAKLSLSTSHFRHWFLPLVAITGILVGLQAPTLWFDMQSENLWGPAIFQPSIYAILGLMGYFTLLIWILEFAFGKQILKPTGIIKTFSTGILWIYLVHTCVGVPLASLFARQISPKLALWTFPLLLLLLSYGVGRLVIYLASKRVRIRITKVSE